MNILVLLLVGLIAGALAGMIWKGRGFGLIADIVIGLLGALVGGWVFSLFGVDVSGILWSIVSATIGALILLAIVKGLRKATA